MKRVAVLCVGILVLAFVPAVVSAQGLLPGLPAFGGMFGGRAVAGKSHVPRVGAPVLYVGWMEGPRSASGLGRSGRFGPGWISQAHQEYDSRSRRLVRLSDRSALRIAWDLWPLAGIYSRQTPFRNRCSMTETAVSLGRAIVEHF